MIPADVPFGLYVGRIVRCRERMSDYYKLYPTWGDLAREQVRRRGLPYFEDVQKDIQNRLAKLLPSARTAFALSCAERLMRAYERSPAIDQSSSALSWRPILDVMWLGLAGQQPLALQRVQAALDEYRTSAEANDDSSDEHYDVDGEDAAAASIYAAECYIAGEVQQACWAASLAVDAAFRIAEDDLQLDPNAFAWDPDAEPMPLAQEAMHQAVQAELQRQQADLILLEQHDLSLNIFEQLKRSNTA
jgi:hypothetical protein